MAALITRAWQQILDQLPSLHGKRILDLGCGPGEQAAALAAQGALVTGIDIDQSALLQAQQRQIPNTTFIQADLHHPLQLHHSFDGLFCCYTAAYFPAFSPILQEWRRWLAPNSWAAFIEIDDLFGHEPLDPNTQQLLNAYAQEALDAGRYDFHMGRKLEAFLRDGCFLPQTVQNLSDPEFAFDGQASPDSLEAWARRFERMKLLQTFCGEHYAQVRSGFLHSLSLPEHRSKAKVIGIFATLAPAP